MIPAAIFLFLFGAVLTWAFRVWILVPICLLSLIAGVGVALSLDDSLATAFGYGLLLAVSPQIGYAFGLLAQGTLLGQAAQPRSNRRASVALLYKRASVDRTGH
jgi:hypothetical protein